MYPDPATSPAVMASPVVLPLHIEFEEERLTSDGGLPWLAEAEAAVGVCAALAMFLPLLVLSMLGQSAFGGLVMNGALLTSLRVVEVRLVAILIGAGIALVIPFLNQVGLHPGESG